MRRIWVAGELSLEGNWRILGLFSSAELAVAAIPARPRGFIFPYPLDVTSESSPESSMATFAGTSTEVVPPS